MTEGGIELDPIDESALTLWDRRMVSAISTANAARKGVVVLRVIAAVVALAALVGNALTVLEFDNAFSDASGWQQGGFPDRYQWGQLLGSVAGPWAFAGLIVAASYLLSVYAARLDMDIILADNEETDRLERSSDDDTDRNNSTSNGNADGDSMFKP